MGTNLVPNTPPPPPPPLSLSLSLHRLFITPISDLSLKSLQHLLQRNFLSLSLSEMDSPSMEKYGPPMAQTLSPCSSGRRSCDSRSPEFEFWMVRNPSFPQPNLLSADELFVDGVLLPLHLLHLHPQHHSDDPPDDTLSQPSDSDASPNAQPEPGPELSAPASALTASKRWKDIFRKTEKKKSSQSEDKEKEKRKERKSGGGGASSAELNINIWPFSRSRSAGNGGNRPKMGAGVAAARKVSSAPCSRSNSGGESKTRKWPSSPSRGGVHLGRSSPVWQVRRASRSSDPAVARNAEKGAQKEANESRRKKPAGSTAGTKTRVLNLNVPMCIGYRQHLSCRSDESGAVSAAAAVDGGGQSGSGDGVRGGNMFNLRSLFTKKVY
ncbi:uncharacterized protein LOC127808669 [Diospyros lotus]|uniref:uncharacterized protein LOC127808669 n=1 Tax=Diospyros lotus TaxID=55363 RepID=UPI002251F757|nr:uncharacterized protein LOC127808669 [Diospyros lotus]